MCFGRGGRGRDRRGGRERLGKRRGKREIEGRKGRGGRGEERRNLI